MKIEVRKYKPEYAEVHYLAVRASIGALKKWFRWATESYCLCESIEFTKNQLDREREGHYAFAIFDKKDGEFLGNLGLNISPGTGILNYWRRSDTYKRNIIPEAIKKLVKAPNFRTFGLNSIEIHIADCNIASIKVAERIGAEAVSTMPVPDACDKKHPGKKYIFKLKALSQKPRRLK